MVTTVGFSTGAHDVSYSVLRDGKPVIHAEIERYNRQKECNADTLRHYLDNKDKFPTPETGLAFEMPWKGGVKTMYPDSYKDFIREFGDLKFVPHHTAHAANAFFSSNFKQALIISLDGGGTEEGVDTAFCVYEGNDKHISRLAISSLHKFNIGGVWSKTCDMLLERGVGNQSGTLMAMAAFGEPQDDLVDMFTAAISRCGQLTFSTDNIFDVCAALQKSTENIIEEILLQYKHVSNNVCFVGGVALNSSCLGKLAMKYPELTFYVPPVPYDSGLALGVSQLYHHSYLGVDRVVWDPFFSPYLGESYTVPDSILSCGRSSNLEEVVKLLEEGKIISVYQGNSESGRRALGNRSILASPFDISIKDKINSKVKNRQSFRPFAPSVLKEDTLKYFERDVDSPYMSLCIPFNSYGKSTAPGVVHEDGTGRLQTVHESLNKNYYDLLSAWKSLTGESIILNTSFNNREPIVETPQDALNCFNKTDIDCLYYADHGVLLTK